MPSNYKRMRKILKEKITVFVEENQFNDKILLIKLPPGIGKTVTGSKTLFSRSDILTIWLSPNHGQIKDTVMKHNSVFHLKGRRILCRHRLLGEFERYNVNIKKVLCLNCEQFKRSTCTYFNQYRELRDAPQSFVSVHHHLNTKFIEDYFRKNKRRFPFRCLVIDENPIGNLIHKTSFNIRDLIDFVIICGKVVEKLIEDGFYPSNTPLVLYKVHYALRRIIQEGDVVKGIVFVRKFIKFLCEDHRLTLEEIENSLKSKEMAFLVKSFNDELYKYFERGHHVNNVIFELLFIAKKCIFYDKKKPEYFGDLKIEKDFNVPFYSDFEDFTSDGMSSTDMVIRCIKVVKDLPEVPIIIMDASGDEEFYSSIFNRKVEVLDLKDDIERSIVQVMDGMYNIASLSNRRTRENVFNTVYQIVKHHLDKGEERVSIITLKRFEEGLRNYLTRRSITRIYINHYGNIRGLNVMKKDKTIILVGTPEPNVASYPNEVANWYEGEKPIRTDRVKENKRSSHYCHDYRYKDQRYFAHIRTIREHEIEQTIDRLRFLLYSDKKAYLISMLPISFPTHKTNIMNLLLELDPKTKIFNNLLKALRNHFYVYLQRLEDGDTKTVMYRKIENVVPFNEDRTKIKITRTILLKDGEMVEEDGRLYITKEGEDYLKKANGEIFRLRYKLST